MERNTEDCDKGIHGDCCCNCKSQVEVRCHPHNKTIGNGSIMKNLGFGCIAMYGDEAKNKLRACVFNESMHGVCELHNRNLKES